ncbi:hypothetical protein CBR_g51935 [Chara braunii]|uniref:Uncharacterized protein n=1 Tax=Chara braunii TaxID=69332 RepID=A0A388M9H5_CHABU|nr:hypothetical protein CBR_g51935 [Chara braunii]|eukprot:GBG91133.1 hypothetical protein CBR_g51935 [Chara braunii]
MELRSPPRNMANLEGKTGLKDRGALEVSMSTPMGSSQASPRGFIHSILGPAKSRPSTSRFSYPRTPPPKNAREFWQRTDRGAPRFLTIGKVRVLIGLVIALSLMLSINQIRPPTLVDREERSLGTDWRPLVQEPNVSGPGTAPIVVRNLRESWGVPQYIKFESKVEGKRERHLFNPTAIPLPENSTHRYVAVVRTTKWKIIHENREYEDAHIVGCLFDDADGSQGDRYIRCATPAVDLDLPIDWRGTDERYANATAKKKKPSFWEYFIGPEDPRLFWSLDGRPLMLYVQVNPQGRGMVNLKSQWLTDLRVVMAGLDEALPEPYKLRSLPPGMHRENLHSEKLAQDVEKNWVPFYDVDVPPEEYIRSSGKDANTSTEVGKTAIGRRMLAADTADLGAGGHESAAVARRDGEKGLHFVARFRPYVVHRYLGPGGRVEPVTPLPEDKAAYNCFERLMSPHEGRPYNTHGGTTPVLVTLCNRGDCAPTVWNTIFLAVLHVLDYGEMEGRWYRRYAVTWNCTSPFVPISISPRVLVFGLQARGGVLFDTTMSFTRSPPFNLTSIKATQGGSPNGRDLRSKYNLGLRDGFDHGYLDDEVIVSLGIGDWYPLVFYSDPRSFLKNHSVCGDHVSRETKEALWQIG